MAELVMISIPAFLLSYGVAGLLAKAVGDTVLKNVTSGIAKQMAQESSAANLGGGAEAESFSKTLTDIHMDIQPEPIAGDCIGRWPPLDSGIHPFFTMALA